MTALRIPTPAQNDLILRDHAQRYAEIQALKRAESVARDACCDVAANDEAPSVVMEWAAHIGSYIAGLGTWAAVGYATWWAAGLFFGAHA